MPPPLVVHGKVMSTASLQAGLAHLARDVAGPIGRRAVAAACRPVLDAARAVAPARTGAYRASLGYVVRTYHTSRVTVGVVGVMRDFVQGTRPDGSPRRPSDYANLVEGGRGPVRVKNRRVLSDRTTIFGVAVRSAQGHFVLKRAVLAGRGAALAALAREVAAGIAAAHVVPVPGG